MASNINPTIIDGAYPIPGQDNDSQGFRDNFTNTRNNFQSAKNELEDLQTKAIVNAQLSVSGLTTADPAFNNLNGVPLHNARLRDMKETVVVIDVSSGTINLDYAAGHYQRIDDNSSGPITLQFTNLPAANLHAWVRFEVFISDVAHTLTLPESVSRGLDKVRGLVTYPTPELHSVITFEDIGTYIFEFYTRNGDNNVGIIDLVRRENPVPVVPVGLLSLWPDDTTVPAGWVDTGRTVELDDASTLHVIQKI